MDSQSTGILLDRRSDVPLHRQLRRHFTRLIANDELSDGEYLPSTRTIAKTLGINRLTALRAFQAMQRAGIVRSQRGRGYYVSKRHDHRPPGDMTTELFGTPASYEARPEQAFSETVRSAADMPMSFAVGYPDISLMPVKPIRSLFGRWSAIFDGRDLAYHAPGGHPLLRARVWQYLAERGIERRQDRELLITNGAQHALDLFMRTFAKSSGFVAMEAPAYYGAIAAARINQFAPLPILQDENGLSVASLAALCKSSRIDFLYTNPTYNNPTGVTMSQNRRDAVVQLAREQQFMILEDNTYADLGFGLTRPTSLMELDKYGRTFHIGSFSKSFIPGLRLGFIVGPKALIKRMGDVHGVNDMCSSTLSQLVLFDALESGVYDRHVKRMRSLYARRCRALVAALQSELSGSCRFTRPKGGFFCWIRMPEHIDCREVQRRCNAVGVDVARGPEFFLEGYGGNYLRLNFTLLEEPAIQLGVKLMAGQIRDMIGMSQDA